MKKSLITIGLIAMLLVVAGCMPKTQPVSEEDKTVTQEESATQGAASEDAQTGIDEVSAEDEELTKDELSETDSELEGIEEALA